MNVVHILEKQALELPQQVAIRHGKGCITFASLSNHSAQGGQFLKSLGLKPGDTVLVFVPMSIDLYVILMSIWRLGAHAMFLDPSSGKEKIAQCCERQPPKAFIGIPKAQLLRLMTPSLRAIPIAISTGFSLFCKKWSSIKAFDELAIAECADDEPALITFTSGSTGLPKGTIRSHGFLMAQNRILAKTLNLKPGNADLATLPVFALINLANGVTTIIPSEKIMSPGKVNGTKVLAEISKYKPQSAVASPAFFECLLKSPNRHELQHLDVIFTGGAPVFPQLLKNLQKYMPDKKVYAVFGSTEAEPIAEMAFTDMSESDLQKMAAGKGLLTGPCVKDISCRIIGDHWGQQLQSMTSAAFDKLQLHPMEPGEIVVYGDHVLKSYLGGYGDEENKFQVDEQIWHRTGDLGYFDDQNRLWLLGRCTAKVKDGHYYLYPFAVETAAMQVDAVKRAAMCQVEELTILVIDSPEKSHKLKKSLEGIAKEFNIDQLLFLEIPLDKRHNAKIDYPELMKSINSKKRI